MFICNARKQNIPDLTDQHQSEAAFEGKCICQNCEVHWQVFPFFPCPSPLIPLFCSRPNFGQEKRGWYTCV